MSMLAFLACPPSGTPLPHGGVAGSIPSTALAQPVTRSVGQQQLPDGRLIGASICAAVCSTAKLRRKQLCRKNGNMQVGRVSRAATAADDVLLTKSELRKEVIQRSKYPDEEILPGDLAEIHYKGWLEDGTLFDSSFARRKTFKFTMGEGAVIDGWELLILTMSFGEVARFTVPPEFAYGEEGVEGIIPPNNTLKFEVQLVDIQRPLEYITNREAEFDDVGVEARDEKERYKDAKDAKEAEAAAETDEAANADQLYWEKDPDKEEGRSDGWSWAASASGNGNEILVTVPLPEDAKMNQMKVDVRTASMKITLGGKTIIDGELSNEVLMDDSLWDLERKDGQVCLVVSLAKMKDDIRWDSVLKGGDPAPPGAVAPAKDVEVL